MYKYYCLNPISNVGLDKFTDEYAPASDAKGADAILVRSAAMHEMEFEVYDDSIDQEESDDQEEQSNDQEQS